jgi:hypothetical protein
MENLIIYTKYINYYYTVSLQLLLNNNTLPDFLNSHWNVFLKKVSLFLNSIISSINEDYICITEKINSLASGFYKMDLSAQTTLETHYTNRLHIVQQAYLEIEYVKTGVGVASGHKAEIDFLNKCKGCSSISINGCNLLYKFFMTNKTPNPDNTFQVEFDNPAIIFLELEKSIALLSEALLRKPSFLTENNSCLKTCDDLNFHIVKKVFDYLIIDTINN